MAVTVFFGRAGSGKTRRCLGRIAEALVADPMGPPIYLIVPRQATFIMERELTIRTGGFCRARVLSFDSLGEMILAECGGAAVPQVTAVGRQMIIGHLLRVHADELRFFAQAARQPGLAARLDSTFAEFERSGQGAQELNRLLEEIGDEGDTKKGRSRSKEKRKEEPSGELLLFGGEDAASKADEQTERTVVPELGTLADKIHDLKLIYEAYCAYLGQDRLDHQQRLRHVLSCIDTSSALRGAEVYVDGFGHFTEFERHVLAEMGKVCRSVEVMLMIDPKSRLATNPGAQPAELSLFHPVEQACRRLQETMTAHGSALEGPRLLLQVNRFAAPALRLIERDLLRQSKVHPDEPGEGVELIQALDRRLEVDAVARRIGELGRQGHRLREIVVLARDLDDYEPLIASSFGEHGIPYFVDRRRPVAHHALVQFLRAAVAIAREGWPHGAVMTLIKSGLAGIADDQADELENYVLEHRIRGASPWAQEEPWTFSRNVLRSEDDEQSAPCDPRKMDALRRQIAAGLGPFAHRKHFADRSLRQIVLEVFQLFDRFAVRQSISQWMQLAEQAGEIERREEHAQVWAQLVEFLDQMVELLGDEPADLDEFSQILESGLEQFDLAIAPPTLDQVLVGQVDRTHTPHVRVGFVLGLNEGVFPRVIREDTVLSDAERRELASRRIEIDPDTQRRLLDEDLLAYHAFTRASERLILTRSLTEPDGSPLGPSRYWERVRAMLPRLQDRVQSVGTGVTDPIETIGTPRQLVAALMSWVRGLDDSGRNEDGPWRALYHWLATHPPADDAIDVMRFRSWRALSYTNDASLSPEVARHLYETPARASVSRIESFAACPFRHFSRYVLRLQERVEGDDVSPIDLGNVLHRVLEKIVLTIVAEKKNWPDLPAEQREQLVQALVQEAGRELRSEVLLSNARNRYLLARIQRAVNEVTAAQQAAARRGLFAPRFAELTFGGDDGQLPWLDIKTPQKRLLRLEGKIDRVDIAANEAAVAVIDYKLHSNALSLDRVYHGLSLQLLTYLLVLREGTSLVAGKKLSPAAAFYVKLLRGLEDVKHPSECPADDPEMMDLRTKPRGIFADRFLKALDATAEGSGPSCVINAYVKSDGSCGKRDSTDVADADELAALLEHVRRTIGQLADRMIDGQIDVRPYLMERVSPCPSCAFKCVCRFDPAINRYQTLKSMTRLNVLQRVMGTKEGAS